MFLFFFNLRKVALTGLGAGPRQGQIGLPSTTDELCGPGQVVEALRTHSSPSWKWGRPRPTPRLGRSARANTAHSSSRDTSLPAACQSVATGRLRTGWGMGPAGACRVAAEGRAGLDPPPPRPPLCRAHGAGPGALGAGPVEVLQRDDGCLLCAGGHGAGQRPGRRAEGEGEGPTGPAGRRASSTSPGPACSVHSKPAGAQV